MNKNQALKVDVAEKSIAHTIPHESSRLQRVNWINTAGFLVSLLSVILVLRSTGVLHHHPIDHQPAAAPLLKEIVERPEAVDSSLSQSVQINPSQLLDDFHLYVQYAVIASYCASGEDRPHPCLRNWTECALDLSGVELSSVFGRAGKALIGRSPQMLNLEHPPVMAPALTLGTRVLAHFSTYASDHWKVQTPFDGSKRCFDNLILGRSRICSCKRSIT